MREATPSHDTPHLNSASSLVDLFRKVAQERGPDPAVHDGPRSISYSELDEYSDQLALELRARGVALGSVVGILHGRSAWTQISILGALKAGAAYVPLEPSHPPARIRHIVDDAHVSIVIGDIDTIRSKEIHELQVVSPCAGYPISTDRPNIEIDGDALAYVMYTSGSTGAPKGCMVTHRNVLELLRGAMTVFDISEDDRISLFHPFIFDASVFEFWLAMASGATSVVVPERIAQSPADLLSFLQTEAVTLVSQVPTAFRALARAHEDAGSPKLALRYVILGGENVQLEVISTFLNGYLPPAPTFVNVYGPTETTCVATCRELTRADLTGVIRSPIGTALPHAVVEVRSPGLALVEQGEVGEIMIAGPAVCDGYLGNPELTAARFVSISTPSGPMRYYRTGDIARQLPDGSFEYLGRDDGQMKVRGARVELGEVEITLRSHSVIHDAAATVIENASGAQFLVACVVASRNAPANLEDVLRRYMKETVPRFMAPDRYLFLSELPLTASGKLDRRVVRDLATTRRTGH